jgi:MoaA/NifB/PqqE/SkfB family radical SAM enzyme
MGNLAGLANQETPPPGGGRAALLKRSIRHTLSRLVARVSETVLPADMLLRLRTRREWSRWVDSLTPEVLEDLTRAPAEVKRRLFKTFVQRVEIETHARCNRICSFCPNVIMDRRANRSLANAEMLGRIFQDLGSVDYDGQIVVARYSEPLANRPYLYEQIARARRLVPHAILAITTNTDYLTPTVLKELRGAGLNLVYMSIYLKAKEEWTIELARAYSRRLSGKLSAPILKQRSTATTLQCTYGYPGLALHSTCHNWGSYGTDRGGSLPNYAQETRVGPCRDPFQTFVVDHNGSVMPCCALRSDLPGHSGLVVGDLTVPGTSIFDVYAGRLAGWRRSLLGFGTKKPPCKTCRHRDIPESLVAAIAVRLRKQLERIGCGQDNEAPRQMKPLLSTAPGSEIRSGQ